MRKFSLFPNVSYRLLSTIAAEKGCDIRYKNPCLDLQSYLDINIFRTNEVAFTPTIKDMILAENLFVPRVGHEIGRITSAYYLHQCPQHDLPEVAFIGRSNVGKSSLLKAIFEHAPDVDIKTSKKPGHTKTVHFFKIGSMFCLVDMPGYGYNQPETFTSCVEWYLKSRKNLVKTFLLIDGKVGFQYWDEVALKMLEEFHISYAILMTKIDKVDSSRSLKNFLSVQNIRDKHTSATCFPQIFMTSAKSSEGLAYFKAFLAHITGNLKLENS